MLMMNDITKRLPVRAKDNYGNTYGVELRLKDAPSGTFTGPAAAELTAAHSNRWVLNIVGAPSGWYLGDLLKNPGRSRIAIDFGAGWFCTNLDELMAASLCVL